MSKLSMTARTISRSRDSVRGSKTPIGREESGVKSNRHRKVLDRLRAEFKIRKIGRWVRKAVEFVPSVVLGWLKAVRACLNLKFRKGPEEPDAATLLAQVPYVNVPPPCPMSCLDGFFREPLWYREAVLEYDDGFIEPETEYRRGLWDRYPPHPFGRELRRLRVIKKVHMPGQMGGPRWKRNPAWDVRFDGSERPVVPKGIRYSESAHNRRLIVVEGQLHVAMCEAEGVLTRYLLEEDPRVVPRMWWPLFSPRWAPGEPRTNDEALVWDIQARF